MCFSLLRVLALNFRLSDNTLNIYFGRVCDVIFAMSVNSFTNMADWPVSLESLETSRDLITNNEFSIF